MKIIIFISFFLIGLASYGQTDTATSKPIIQDDVFRTVEQMPEFPGGEQALYKFIFENLEYPPAAIEKDIQGKIYIEFVIRMSGEISDIRILSKEKLGYGCEQAAIDVIKKMPKWKPGKQNGQAVSVYKNLPIRFRLR